MPEIFEVGGCVRDSFLGIESKDIDFTFVLDFDIMSKHLDDEGFQVFLKTPECFTIRAKFPKEHQFEGLVADFVMARKEIGYIEGTRKPILKLGTLHDDLERRDFTVNAIAKDVEGNFIDPFDGQADIKNKLLKTPLDPMVTMMDDPLRVLRALRFSITKNFDVDQPLIDAMRQPDILKKLKETVSVERMREEVTKMMRHDTPASMRVLFALDFEVEGFLDLVFGDKMWLKPTMEKR
jgi:tRNA nucleotidyltransferase/poly(A) polymerase